MRRHGGTRAKDVTPGQFVRGTDFYGTVESVDCQPGCGVVTLHLACGYTYTVPSATRLGAS